jgi:predicted ABC-type ATPase
MVAGPNGAGKTTLVQWLRQRGVDFGDYINPDDIAQQLEGSYDDRVRQAQVIADRRREECIEARRSFSFETVMSHPSKVDILVRAKSAGFFVQLFFVGTEDPEISIERVALRVAQGGHDVPTDRIIARWFRTMGQLSEAIESSDRAFIFDNTASGGIEARRLILTWDSVGFQWFSPLPAWVQRYVLDPLELSDA